MSRLIHLPSLGLPKPPLVPTRPLGMTGMRTSIIGLGGVGLGDIYGAISDSQAVDTIIRALELGITLLDTAPNYGMGKSERRIGMALGQYDSVDGCWELKDGKLVASQPIIVTKCGDEGPHNGGHSPFSKLGVLESYKSSLKNLRGFEVDVFLLHDPTQKELDEFFTPKTGGIETFKELRESGEIRSTGIGVREHDVLLNFMKNPSMVADVALIVNDWNLLRRYASVNLLPMANRLGVTILNGGPFYMGLLSGIDPSKSFSEGIKENIDIPEVIELATEMNDWCQDKEIDLRGLALRFATGMCKVDAPGSDKKEIAYGIRNFQSFSPPISAALIGAKSVSEVEDIVMSLTTSLEDDERYNEIALAFEKEFGDRVDQLDPNAHFYYDKTKVDLG